MPTRARLRRLQRKFCSRVSRAEPHSSMNLFLFASIPPPIFSSSSSSSLSGVCFFLLRSLSHIHSLVCALFSFTFSLLFPLFGCGYAYPLFGLAFLFFFFFFFLTLYLKGLCFFISKMIMVCNIYCIIKCYIIFNS
jgi:hypothetical protein